MTTNQLMFMYAVEEMSFSKAAQKAFVTQQCLSNHIHRLEVSCGVKLLNALLIFNLLKPEKRSTSPLFKSGISKKEPCKS